jgi:hypothetical protein
MITQLNPALPLVTPRGKGLAHLVIDYGTDHDLVWVVFQSDGQVWCWRNQEIRAEDNITFGRVSGEKS